MKPFLVYCVMLFLPSSVFSALQIDIKPHQKRCIGQELDQEDSAIFSFRAIHLVKDFALHELVAKITDPDGGSLFDGLVAIDREGQKIEKQIETRGVYKMCFHLRGGAETIRIIIDIDFKHSSSDPSKKVEDISTLESQLKSAEDSLRQISREIDFARRQEDSLKGAGEAVDQRIQWFAFFSIIILLTTSFWQILYLRHYFTSKKLL